SSLSACHAVSVTASLPTLHFLLFFCNGTASTEIYTLFPTRRSSDLGGLMEDVTDETAWRERALRAEKELGDAWEVVGAFRTGYRSEEHTSELQSRENLVCRLLLEKKKNYTPRHTCRISDRKNEPTA